MNRAILAICLIFLANMPLRAHPCRYEDLVATYQGESKSLREIFRRENFWLKDFSTQRFELSGKASLDFQMQDLRLYMHEPDQSVWLYPFAVRGQRDCVEIGRLVEAKHGPLPMSRLSAKNDDDKESKLKKIELFVTIVEIAIHLIK